MIKKITFYITLHFLANVNLICSISLEDAKKIGMQIWQNEASQRVDLLVFWSPFESFPSLGIGHCIWYPQGHKMHFTEQFPLLCNYLQEHGVQLPEWLEKTKNLGAPWSSRNEFLQDEQRTEELRNLLVSNINLQTYFMIERLDQKLPLIIKEVNPEKQTQVLYNLELMKSSLLGTYALIDYLNFKGDGLNPKEERNGDRWGLLQVLLDMPDNLTIDNVTKAFVISAAKILLRLIQNSGPEYKSIKFFYAWMKRISSYANSDLFIETD